MNCKFYQETEEGLLLYLKVSPGASQNKIGKLMNGEQQRLKIYVTAAPEDGKANESIIKLLSEKLSIPKSLFTITKGLTSSEKMISIKIKSNIILYKLLDLTS